MTDTPTIARNLSEAQQAVKIEQCDRDAAENSYRGFLASIKGEDDGMSLVQAFAAHRLAERTRLLADLECPSDAMLIYLRKAWRDKVDTSPDVIDLGDLIANNLKAAAAYQKGQSDV